MDGTFKSSGNAKAGRGAPGGKPGGALGGRHSQAPEKPQGKLGNREYGPGIVIGPKEPDIAPVKK